MTADDKADDGVFFDTGLAIIAPDSSHGHTLRALMKAGAPAAPDPKRVATAQARAALVGAVLTPSQDDHGRPCWLLSRWTLTREFTSLDELDRVLTSMGAPG